jgi:uncharacterized protein YbjT (DUF2867 family)
VGRAVVREAVERGHDVTALVRDPDRLPSSLRSVPTITGDLIREPDVLDRAIQGQSVVISALGVGKSFKSGALIQTTAPAIVAAMRRHGVRRLIFTSAFGVGATYRDTPLLPRLFIATLLRDIYADKNAGESAILQSDLDWTVVYPAGLTDGPSTGRYRAGERLPLRGFPTIARADVADFLLRQVDDRTFVRKGVLIAR